MQQEKPYSEKLQIDIKGKKTFGIWYERKYNVNRNYCNIGDYIYKSKVKLKEIIDIITSSDFQKYDITFTFCCNSEKTFVETKTDLEYAIIKAQIKQRMNKGVN